MLSKDDYFVPPCLCNKVNMISRMINTMYRKAFTNHNISNEQISILLVLNATKKRTQQHLADKLSIEKSTFSRNIVKMIDNGWINRTQGKNAKEKVISLTSKGRDKHADVLPIWQEVQRKATRMLGFSTIKELDRMLIELKKETQNA